MVANNTVPVLAQPALPIDTVPRERHEAVVQLVGRLLTERDKILAVLQALVTASAPHRHVVVTIKGEPHLGIAWREAEEICRAWQLVQPQIAEQKAAAARAARGGNAPPLAEQQ
jgi:hypothetical protein